MCYLLSHHYHQNDVRKTIPHGLDQQWQLDLDTEEGEKNRESQCRVVVV